MILSYNEFLLYEQLNNTILNIFTDGSYKSNKCGFGWVITDAEYEPIIENTLSISDENCKKYQSIYAEVYSAQLALEFIVDKKMGNNIIIYHDYKSINPIHYKWIKDKPNSDVNQKNTEKLFNNWLNILEKLKSNGYNIQFKYTAAHEPLDNETKYSDKIIYTEEYRNFLILKYNKETEEEEKLYIELENKWLNANIKDKYNEDVLKYLFNSYVDKKISNCIKYNKCSINPDNINKKQILRFIDIYILKRDYLYEID